MASLSTVVATVAHWVDDEPHAYEVRLLMPTDDISKPVFNTIVISAFLQERLEALLKDPKNKDNPRLLGEFLEAGRKGKLQIALPPFSATIPEPTA